MQVLTNAQRYDWTTWFMGIMRAFISGGGGALSGGLGPMMADPDHFNVGAGLTHLLSSMELGFLVGAVISLGIFLHTHGAPDALVQQALETAVQSQKAVGAAQKQASADVRAVQDAVDKTPPQP